MQDLDAVLLTHAVDSAHPLLQHGGIPRHFQVDHDRSRVLQVQPLSAPASVENSSAELRDRC